MLVARGLERTRNPVTKTKARPIENREWKTQGGEENAAMNCSLNRLIYSNDKSQPVGG